MGVFRFVVPVEWNLDSYHSNAIHVVGIDGVAWPCRISVTDESPTEKVFSVTRNMEESGRTFVIYPFAQRGELLICTGTLPAREQPYDLLTELARGTLNRLRNQISIWEEGGLEQDGHVDDNVAAATRLLAEAIHCGDSFRRAEVARQSLELSIEAIFELADTFGEQVSQFRRDGDSRCSFWLAHLVGSGPECVASTKWDLFDLLEVCQLPDVKSSDVKSSEGKMTKEQIEQLGKRVIVGPWLDASSGGLAPALVAEQGFSGLKNKLLADCRQQLEDLPATASLLHVVSGLNGIGHRDLSYAQQLQLTMELLRLAEDALVDIPTMVSFDFPWGERLAGAVGGVPPLQIADSLMRQGIQVAFLGLDINLDYWPNGSAMRDPLQWIDLLDSWAQLGLPLVLCLRAPSGVVSGAGELPQGRQFNQTLSNITDEQRVDFLKTVLPMMVARPSVHGMIWRQWQDHDDLRYPRAGLVDADGHPKRMASALDRMKAAIGN